MHWQPPTIAQLVALARHIRDEQPEIWSIFERIGFHDYMAMDEIQFVHTKLPDLARNFWQRGSNDAHQDAFIILGLLARLAEGLLHDEDLEGEWVTNFIEDRRHDPRGRRPIELGWIMALAREIDADPKYWNYFISLTDFQHNNPRERPGPNPINNRISQFREKHCLHNRDSTLGIWPLLYSKHEDYAHLQHAKIDDITDVDQVKEALAGYARTEPSTLGGVNLNVYFEDLDR